MVKTSWSNETESYMGNVEGYSYRQNLLIFLSSSACRQYTVVATNALMLTTGTILYTTSSGLIETKSAGTVQPVWAYEAPTMKVHEQIVAQYRQKSRQTTTDRKLATYFCIFLDFNGSSTRKIQSAVIQFSKKFLLSVVNFHFFFQFVGICGIR